MKTNPAYDVINKLTDVQWRGWVLTYQLSSGIMTGDAAEGEKHEIMECYHDKLPSMMQLNIKKEELEKLGVAFKIEATEMVL